MGSRDLTNWKMKVLSSILLLMAIATSMKGIRILSNSGSDCHERDRDGNCIRKIVHDEFDCDWNENPQGCERERDLGGSGSDCHERDRDGNCIRKIVHDEFDCDWDENPQGCERD